MGIWGWRNGKKKGTERLIHQSVPDEITVT